MDDDILPDMGRMTARLRSGARTISSPAPTMARLTAHQTISLEIKLILLRIAR
jgi:hypothetical protein